MLLLVHVTRVPVVTFSLAGLKSQFVAPEQVEPYWTILALAVEVGVVPPGIMPANQSAATTITMIATAPTIAYIVFLLFGFAGSDGFGACSIFSTFLGGRRFCTYKGCSGNLHTNVRA